MLIPFLDDHRLTPCRASRFKLQAIKLDHVSSMTYRRCLTSTRSRRIIIQGYVHGLIPGHQRDSELTFTLTLSLGHARMLILEVTFSTILYS